MTGQIRSDSNTMVVVLNSVDEYTFRAGGGSAANPKDVVTFGVSKLTSAVAQASTSGTSIDFTGIPAWAKRVTLMFSSVSTNGTSPIQIQLGAGSPQTTGYLGSKSNLSGTSVGSAVTTTGFGFDSSGAANLFNGSVTFTLLGSNTWACQGVVSLSNTSSVCFVSGSVVLSGVLDRLRLTTINGTDAFDLGTVNILWE